VEADAGVKAPLPLTRRLTGAFAFEVRDDSLRTVFVRIRQIVDPPGGESMAGFVARVFARVDSIDSRRLILDLRRNGGGNNYLNQPLVHALIQRATRYPTGRLFVLVDRGTFSAAMSLAAALERETRALFVGEPTGGAPNAPGDPGRVRLPASGLVARISTVQWDGSDPRDTRPAIFPDLPVSLTWADWLARRDLALDAIEGYRPSADATERPPNTRWGSRAQQQGRFPAVAW
jgi:hypothetical protein